MTSSIKDTFAMCKGPLEDAKRELKQVEKESEETEEKLFTLNFQMLFGPVNESEENRKLVAETTKKAEELNENMSSLTRKINDLQRLVIKKWLETHPIKHEGVNIFTSYDPLDQWQEKNID